MSRTRVVVTGMGTTNPVGGDVPTTWEGMLDGRSGVRHLTDDWAEQMPVKIAGRVAVEPSEILERVKARRWDRSTQFAMVAAMEAWKDAGLEGAELDGERVGVAMASGIGGVTTLLSNYDVYLEKGPRRVSPLAVPMLMPNAPAANISLYVGARAAVNTPVSACASGNEAIALAVDQIRLGRADLVVAGGTEAAIHPLPMAAFANMMALSKNDGDPTTVSRPWDTGRDGFVLGEGAGVLVLESEEHAEGPRCADLRRGARGRHHRRRPRHRPARPGRSGWLAGDPAGARRVRDRRQRDRARQRARHVDPAGGHRRGPDAARHLGPARLGVVVTSTKSMTGHLLGGAGALESIATVLALHHRVVPPTINLDDQDPQVELDIATKPRDLPEGDIAALNNSFGFGGANVAVAFGSV